MTHDKSTERLVHKFLACYDYNLDDLKWQKFEVQEFHETNSNLIEFLLAILEPFFLKLRFTFLSNFGWPTAESILAQKIKLFHKFTF